MKLDPIQIEFTRDELSPQLCLEYVQSPSCGACLLFVGTTRAETKGRQTDYLIYECYELMARKQAEQLLQQAQQQWNLHRIALAHRLGRVPVGAASIALAVSSPHRAAAFESGAWLMDQIKQLVPIWKQEHWSDGQVDWVHPHHPAPDRPSNSAQNENPGGNKSEVPMSFKSESKLC